MIPSNYCAIALLPSTAAHKHINKKVESTTSLEILFNAKKALIANKNKNYLTKTENKL